MEQNIPEWRANRRRFQIYLTHPTGLLLKNLTYALKTSTAEWVEAHVKIDCEKFGVTSPLATPDMLNKAKEEA